MVEKVYYESDFAAVVSLPEGVGDNDFELEVYTDGHRVIKFYRNDGKLSHNLIKNDKGQLLALFRDHGLNPGKLLARFNFVRDGLMQVARWRTNIELTPIAIDASTIPTLDLVGGAPEGGGQPSAELPAEVLPTMGEATTRTIKTTTIKFSRPVSSADVENVKLVTPNGVLLLGYGGGDYTIDGATVTINWALDAVEGDYELRIPRGAFTLDNGAESAAYNASYNVVTAPVVYFTPKVVPAGNVTAITIKRMVVTFPSPIESFDGSNVRLAKNFGSVWYDYAATGTISADKLSMTIVWDFAPEVGLAYNLELPEGCITLENGDKNAETKVGYTVYSAE